MQKSEYLTAYEIKQEKVLGEMNSTGTVLEHKKTGARIFLISNDDENKVFTIGFRTPPADDTGLPHILEHSVLCGSEKFPLKDPFVELVKGSLNTFLNAMTYPDKTVYPVASCNEKDFQNLMDVYMDAVLHPNIYNEEKIFLQEGWHYELEDADAPLIYNGVVYNEMKGAYSSPESLLERSVQKLLFPDNCYGKDSGGDPAAIPALTYETFLDFHRSYYHPSNSFIYLYGDMDMAEKLKWLDEEYLSRYEHRNVDSHISRHPAFAEPKEEEIFYSITEDEPEEDATYLSVSTVVEAELDARLYMAFQVLEYALLDAPGAPLKQELLDAGIGQDIMGGYESGILQPYFSVIAKGTGRDRKGEFLAVVKGTLRKLADQGINQKSLSAGINFFEFKYREADFGSAPKGLMYGLQCFDSWLYDGDPMMHLEYEETFAFLKKAVNEGYFEQLIRTYLLDNPYEAVVIVSPKKNLTTKEDEALAQKLAAHKAALSEAERNHIMEETRALKEYQDTPSTPEEMAKIPLLKREDIRKEAEKFYWIEKEVGKIKILHHNFHTSGIGYLKLVFDTSVIPQEDLYYVGLLKSVLGNVDTEHYSYSDLTSEIHQNSGGVDFSVASYMSLGDEKPFTGTFIASARVIYDRLDFGFSIISEILTRSKLEDEKRLGEVINETRSRAKMRMESAGHSVAVSRGTSYFVAASWYNEMTAGTAYYHFLEKLAKNYEQEKKSIIAKLKEVCEKLFTSSNLLVNYTADDEGFSYLPEALGRLTKDLPKGSNVRYPFEYSPENKNEGFKTASQVNYVARCGDFRAAGYEYTGVLKILQVIMSYDYLWLNVRVKGGAYGCMSGFGRSGEGYFVSYRDPNLRETNAIYEGIIPYLENFNVDERDMTKYVIGSISNLDTPLTPSVRGARGLSAYLSGITEEMMQTERDQVLNATAADIRALAPIVQAILDTGSFCVVGNAEKIEANKEMFGRIDNLSH